MLAANASLVPGDTRPAENRPGSAHTVSTLHELRHALSSPLRRLGLDSGRALANAQPSPEQLRASRAVQLAYIREAHPKAQRPVA